MYIWYKIVFLVQHVVAPTRGNTVLDLVLPSEAGMMENLDISDHNCWCGY